MTDQDKVTPPEFINISAPLDHLIKALEVIRDTMPPIDEGTDLDAWRRDIRERLIIANIDPAPLQAFSLPLERITVTRDGAEIITPGENVLSEAEAWAAFVSWIISDRPTYPVDVQATKPHSLSLPAELLSKRFFPMLNGPMVTDMMQLSLSKVERNTSNNTALYITREGHELKVDKFNELMGTLSVSAKKILNHAILYLKNTNYYRGHPRSIIPTVEIPIEEYAKLTGNAIFPAQMPTPEEQEQEDARAENTLKKLKKAIRRDLHDISSIVWSAEETKGKNRGNYAEMRIISSHSIKRGNILRINFDVDAAVYMLNSYMMQYPKVLYSYDERKPNAFAIAYKIAQHNSNDTNFERGTNNTLSVASLLDAATDIPTFEQLKETGNRNWKLKIKGVLEKAINESVTMGYLQKWEYRDPKTGTTYTPEEAKTLTFLQWYRLMVDFIVIDPPDQSERRASIAEAKRLALEAQARKATQQPPKRKRGRPRKNPET